VTVADAVGALCHEYATDGTSLAAVDDCRLYRDVVHAVWRTTWPQDDPWPPAEPACRAALVDRLGTGWFGEPLRSPQARHAVAADLPDVRVADPTVATPSPLARKPAGALWTSSFLPDGSSAWQYGEAAEVGGRRTLYSVAFDDSRVRLHVLDGPEDYLGLVDAFPLRAADGRLGVHWAAAAADLDAVRLTARGLLLCENVPVPGRDDVAPLQGWGAESTAWFRPPPGAVVTLVSV
jgi:hypothetical protein